MYPVAPRPLLAGGGGLLFSVGLLQTVAGIQAQIGLRIPFFISGLPKASWLSLGLQLFWATTPWGAVALGSRAPELMITMTPILELVRLGRQRTSSISQQTSSMITMTPLLLAVSMIILVVAIWPDEAAYTPGSGGFYLPLRPYVLLAACAGLALHQDAGPPRTYPLSSLLYCAGLLGWQLLAVLARTTSSMEQLRDATAHLRASGRLLMPPFAIVGAIFLVLGAAAWSNVPLAAPQSVKVPALGHCVVSRLGSCVLRAHLTAPSSSALPGRGRSTGGPATASGARASRLQSRRFRRL